MRTEENEFFRCVIFWGTNLTEQNGFSPIPNITPCLNITDLCRYYKPAHCVKKANFLCCMHITGAMPSTEDICRSISYQQQDSSFMLNLESSY